MKGGQVTSSGSIICIPYLSDVLNTAELVNERDCGKSIERNGQKITLGGTLHQPQNLTIHKQLSGLFVGVYEYIGKGWAEVLDVAYCHLPIQLVECVGCIDQEYCFNILMSKQ